MKRVIYPVLLVFALLSVLRTAKSGAEEPAASPAQAVNAPFCRELQPVVDRHLERLAQLAATDGTQALWAKEAAAVREAEKSREALCTGYLAAIAEALENAVLMHLVASQSR